MRLPISVVIPTRNRPKVLAKTLATFLFQLDQPSEIIIVDGSEAGESKELIEGLSRVHPRLFTYLRADRIGAAAQRNQGVAKASQPFILFADDDVYLESDCLTKLWGAIGSQDDVGAVNAMITNQRYTSPGFISRTLYRLLSGENLATYAGKLIGPAWNLLPEDRDDLPEYVRCEWLNTTCTVYRRSALPAPVFAGHFKGYSMMEDVALSFSISRNWRLLNARTARVFHDSQSGDHKSSQFDLARMEINNRHYLMTRVMTKRRLKDYLGLGLFEAFGIISNLRSLRTLVNLPSILAGKAVGIFDILSK